MKKLIALSLAVVILFGFNPVRGAEDSASATGDLPFVPAGDTYATLGPVPAAHMPERAIELPLFSFAEGAGIEISNNYLDYSGDVLKLEEDGEITYTVTVPRDGRYALHLTYAALPGSRSDIEIAVYIDGELPFREAGVIMLRRHWRYADTERRFDNKGNELRPQSTEEMLWKGVYAEDKEGLYTDPFAFFLSEGTHTITLRSIREPFALSQLSLTPPPVNPSYAEVSAGYGAYDIAGAQPVTVLATDAHLRSDPALLPISDRSNPYLEPLSLSTISYNVMGGDMWNRSGQTISWLLDIPEDGLYTLNFVYKQDAVVGLPVTRALRINGQFPFAEMQALTFPYNSDWNRMTVQADGGDALFYLTKGQHELSLSVTLGDTADICRRVTELTTELSSLYTQIVMITGVNPDPLRDYRIDERLPNILGDFDTIARRLDRIAEDINALGGGRNESMTINIMARQLYDFIKQPDTIPGRMARFKDNIVNLSVWVLMSSEMPLALYSVSAAAPGTEFGAVRPGFFGSLWFSVKRFFASFTALADVAGNLYDESEENLINVWGRYGKDYAEVLKRMCDEIFTPETGIKVNFSVLNRDEQMFFAIASGTGPDVCLNVYRSYPLDFGLRGSAVDLTMLPGYDEFEMNFPPTSEAPYSFSGKTYGFPVELKFPVLFVRTDIMADFGLEVPQTWDEFYTVTGVLAEKNLQFRAEGDLMTMFLLQNGGQVFSDDLRYSLLDSPVAIAAMTEQTNMHILHGAPVVSSFFDRFRTGEMPIGIHDHSLFTNLHYAALEIKDNWAIYPVPGVLQEDGTIDRSIISSTGAVTAPESSAGFIANTRPERLDNAWEFVRWFMSAETQAMYAMEIEGMFGVFGRVNTASVGAHASIPWDKAAYQTIIETFSNFNEIPGVPGAYFVGRHMTNASNEIIISGEMPRTAMVKYTEIINREIAWKYEELRLN
ncbi:MAG: extracellular solute-binding protein [Oscillospiraceae bacterium]|nr:extracellular solute-binding protein [Oscillospiraceae bacterium]